MNIPIFMRLTPDSRAPAYLGLGMCRIGSCLSLSFFLSLSLSFELGVAIWCASRPYRLGQIEPMWSMLGTSWAQVELVLGLVWPMLGLRWLRLGLCWAYLGVCWYNGSMLAYVGPITDRTVQSDSPSKTIGDSPCFLFFCSNSLALKTKQQTNTAYHIMPCPDRQTACPMTLLDFMGTPGSDRFWLGAEQGR